MLHTSVVQPGPYCDRESKRKEKENEVDKTSDAQVMHQVVYSREKYESNVTQEKLEVEGCAKVCGVTPNKDREMKM